VGSYVAMPSLAVALADQVICDRLIVRFIAPARTALGEPAWQRAAAWAPR
jgi:hypothetical protein